MLYRTLVDTTTIYYKNDCELYQLIMRPVNISSLPVLFGKWNLESPMSVTMQTRILLFSMRHISKYPSVMLIIGSH